MQKRTKETVLRALLDEPLKSAAYKEALLSASRRDLETALPHAAPVSRQRTIEKRIKELADMEPEAAPPEVESDDDEGEE